MKTMISLWILALILTGCAASPYTHGSWTRCLNGHMYQFIQGKRPLRDSSGYHMRCYSI